MDTSVQVALATGAIGILLAAFNFFFTSQVQFFRERQSEKLSHYKELLAGLSETVGGPNLGNPNRFVQAFNTLALVAPQDVIHAAMQVKEVMVELENSEIQAEHDLRLNNLLLAIRKDLRLTHKDNPATFHFGLLKHIRTERS